MNFDFSEDQNHLRAEARRFLEAHCPPSAVRAVLDDPARGYDEALWTLLVEQGWTAFTVPEAFGGLGMGRIDLCVLAEELGRALAPVPFASTVYILAEALMLAGTEAQQARLRDIAEGRCIGCLALAEGPGEWAPDRVAARVEDGRLWGAKLPVTDGLAATVALVAAKAQDGVTTLFLVDLDQPGIAREPLATLDPTRGAALIRFDAAVCEPIGDAALLDQILDRAAVLLAFEQVGGADRCLEQAVAFAGMRIAFGRPIGSQQAIKHKLADMYVHNQIARSNAYYGAWALDAAPEQLPAAAAAARVAACNAGWYAAKETIQVHGGIGFTWEADQHLFERRALQLSLMIGSAATWRERLVDAVSAQGADMGL
jgi:alkylation response protein AidB-like acyl-CoA dehydrogenase